MVRKFQGAVVRCLQLAEDQVRADRREDDLFQNMAKNTDQLTDIASTLKEAQINIAKIENQVTENFDFLSGEIGNVKTHVAVTTETTNIQTTESLSVVFCFLLSKKTGL